MDVPPRKRGRPKSPTPGSKLSTWVDITYHDRVIALAKRHDMSVSAVVRALLTLKLKSP